MLALWVCWRKNDVTETKNLKKEKKVKAKEHFSFNKAWETLKKRKWTNVIIATTHHCVSTLLTSSSSLMISRELVGAESYHVLEEEESGR